MRIIISLFIWKNIVIIIIDNAFYSVSCNRNINFLIRFRIIIFIIGNCCMASNTIKTICQFYNIIFPFFSHKKTISIIQICWYSYINIISILIVFKKPNCFIIFNTENGCNGFMFIWSCVHTTIAIIKTRASW